MWQGGVNIRINVQQTTVRENLWQVWNPCGVQSRVLGLQEANQLLYAPFLLLRFCQFSVYGLVIRLDPLQIAAGLCDEWISEWLVEVEIPRGIR